MGTNNVSREKEASNEITGQGFMYSLFKDSNEAHRISRLLWTLLKKKFP